MENRLWEKLGIPAEPLECRSWKEVRDYLTIIEAIDREQSQRMNTK